MKARFLALLIPCIALFACSQKEPPPPDVPTPTVTTPATTADANSAQVTFAAKSGSATKGELRLASADGRVYLDGEVWGLKPGEHGFHVHEVGDCSADDASTAGGHLNPTMAQHGGGPTSNGKHLGDMPNILADETGHALISATIAGATLHDGTANDLMGKAVIIHADRDDYTTQPSGAAGARVACGIVK